MGATNSEPAEIDSGTYTWAARTPELIPALHHALREHGINEQIRILILGCGCVRPLGFVPEFLEVSSLFKLHAVEFVVVDHNPEALAGLQSMRYHLPRSVGVHNPCSIESRLDDAAASLDDQDIVAGDLRSLCFDVVRSAASNSDDRTLEFDFQRHHTKTIHSDFETVLFKSSYCTLLQPKFDAVVALNSLWYCATREQNIGRGGQLLDAVLALLAPKGVAFVDEETMNHCTGHAAGHVKQWSPSLFELHPRKIAA